MTLKIYYIYPALKNQFSNQIKNFLYLSEKKTKQKISYTFIYYYHYYSYTLYPQRISYTYTFGFSLYFKKILIPLTSYSFEPFFEYLVDEFFDIFFTWNYHIYVFFFGFFLVFLITLFVFTKINIRNFFTLFILLIHSFYNNSINFSKRSRKKVHSNPHLYTLH